MNKSYRGRRKSPIIEQEHFYMKKKFSSFMNEWFERIGNIFICY